MAGMLLCSRWGREGAVRGGEQAKQFSCATDVIDCGRVFHMFINMAVVWDDKTILKLIELIEERQILWACTTKDYKNKVKKSAAWEEISKILDIPRKDVENKMHILRSQFARERKKIVASIATGAGTADTETCKWKFYDPLKFLLSVATTTASSGTEPMIQTPKKLNKTDHQDTEHSFEAVMCPSTPPPQSPQPEPSSSQKTEKRKTDDNLSEIYQYIKSSKRKMDETKDEFDIYGQYVASELRAAKNEIGVLHAKSYINNILIDMRMGKYNYSGGQTNHGYATASTSVNAPRQGYENIEELVLQIKSESD